MNFAEIVETEFINKTDNLLIKKGFNMKAGLTELVFLLDKSGSMGDLTNDTIDGFNTMINKQKNEEGEAYVTTVLFDNNYKILHNHLFLPEVPLLTEKEYIPLGRTAILDAVGNTINSIGARLNSTPEEERPEKVIFIITTDGCENASREFTKAKVKEMIEHQRNKYSWTFVFLGANMDAVAEASSLGIDPGFSKTYSCTSVGTKSVYRAVANAVTGLRSVNNMTEAAKAVTTALDDIV